MQPKKSDKNTQMSCITCLVLLCFCSAGSFMLIILSNYIGMYYFMQEAERAKQSEAKQYVSSMNGAQKNHFAEKSAFANSVEALGLGIKTGTTSYKYSVRVTKQAAFNYGVSKYQGIKSYVGGVFLIRVKQNKAQDEIRTESILCVADEPGVNIKPIPPKIQNNKLFCVTGTIEVTK